ncbi:threonine-phosphate decarboxylase CobD [Rhizobium sp. PAMB 3174]
MTGGIVHGGGLAAAARQFGGSPADWLDLSTGINPNPCATSALPSDVWHRLPDSDLYDSAREAASVYYGSGSILPLPTPGTQAVIQLLPRLAGGEGRVAIVSPTFGEYARVFAANGFAVDTVGTVGEIGGSYAAAVVVNPNNPDGRTWGRDELVGLHDRLHAEGGLLIVDEAFGDVLPELSLAGQVAAMPGLVVLRSFGKFFGLAGLRLGFVIAWDDLLDRLGDWLGPWAVSGPALAIAANLFKRDTDTVRNRIFERKAALDAVLTDARLLPVGGTPLFSLVETADAQALWRHLAQDHILVRRFDYRDTWLRIGLAPDAAGDQRLAAALADFRGK